MLRGLALGVSLVYGAYLTRNAVLVARIIIPAVADYRRAWAQWVNDPFIQERTREAEARALAAVRAARLDQE